MENLRMLLIGDASLHNVPGGKSQVGYCVFFCDDALSRGEDARISLVAWRSHGSSRICNSTLHSEAYALSEGLAECEWITSLFSSLTAHQYALRRRAQHHRTVRLTALFREPESEKVKLTAISDAKSLYDNLMKESTKGERRACLEICSARQSLAELGGAIRWVPHYRNPVDCLTKIKGNSEPFLRMLRRGRFQLTAEDDELKEREAYRRKTGMRNPRPNVVAGLRDQEDEEPT